MANLGGRKLMITTVMLAAGVTIDLVTERGLSQNLMTLMLGLAGSYIAGNVVTKQVSKPKTSADSDAALNMSLAVDDKLGDVEIRLEQAEQALSGTLNVAESAQLQAETANKRVAALLTALQPDQQNQG